MKTKEQNCIVCRNKYVPVRKSWYCESCKKPSQFGKNLKKIIKLG